MVSDAEARARLLKILDDARTFEELSRAVAHEHAAKTHAVFECAARFLAERDPAGLDSALQERFAQVLSRMVESKEALSLAGVLEQGGGGR
jgi:hypothetical protein